MDLSSYSTVLTTTAGGISGVIGLYYTALKIFREVRKAKKAAGEKLLEQAKEHTDAVKAQLESKITILENQLHNLEVSVTKEIEHVKEIQANEIRNLAAKVDQLREELQESHNHLINLLTTLVNKN